MIESQFFFGHELWQVKSEGGDVGDQVINTLFKRDADTRLPQERTAYEEFHAEQGLPAAGTATDQRRPPPGQTTQGNLVQSFDACRSLGKLPRLSLSLVHFFSHTVDSSPLSRLSSPRYRLSCGACIPLWGGLPRSIGPLLDKDNILLLRYSIRLEYGSIPSPITK